MPNPSLQETPKPALQTPNVQTPQERRALAEFMRLQQKIDRLENELAKERNDLETFRFRLPDAVRAKLSVGGSRIAHLELVTDEQVGLDVGRGYVQEGDTLLIVRSMQEGLMIRATAMVNKPDAERATGHVLSNLGGIRIGDEAYVINRTDSPCSIKHL